MRLRNLAGTLPTSIGGPRRGIIGIPTVVLPDGGMNGLSIGSSFTRGSLLVVLESWRSDLLV